MTQRIENDTPNGHCRKCGFFLLNGAGSAKTCVNCDTHSEPSGVVNDSPDPGHNGMVKELGVMLKPKERALQDTGIKVEKPELSIIKETLIRQDVYTLPEVSIKQIQDYFKTIPVTDLKQAKKLIKLRNEIDKLSNKINEFLGGNENVK